MTDFSPTVPRLFLAFRETYSRRASVVGNGGRGTGFLAGMAFTAIDAFGPSGGLITCIPAPYELLQEPRPHIGG